MGSKVQALRFCFFNTNEIGPEVINQRTNMRLSTLLLCLLFYILSTAAQDVITKTDGTKIEAKIETINDTHVNYRKITNLNGPIYSIPLSSIANILYENGTTDTFNPLLSNTISQSTFPNNDLQSNSSQKATDQYGPVSDHYLLTLANVNSHEELKAKRLRKIGWYGGGAIALTGIIWASILKSNGSELATPVGLCSVIGGAAICIGCQISANIIMKKTQKGNTYTNIILEKECYKYKDTSFLAGVSIMDNCYITSKNIGLSLGIKF